MKFKENCKNCDTKKDCNKYRPETLSETIDCINTHATGKKGYRPHEIICERSNFLMPAIDSMVKNKLLLQKI